MPKHPANSESTQAFAPDSSISVSTDSYISMLDLLCRFISQIAFSLQKEDSPSWLIKMLAGPEERPGISENKHRQ